MDITHESSPVPLETDFNFFQHWYPIALLEDLDPKRPTPITLLGQHYVIWQPRDSNQYLVFHDQCPHRLAPLSEGRIDDQTGQLMCSYHGWQFNAEGHCTHIPQAET
ncbi:MAG: Rieske 2Fe-2S domain-containing protein, partial [Acaryochloris sp. SU_5_25]|nr:Rieske 2Fe-2S domain-containing protein [Acaryochloris sp. SU_5_25]